MFQTYCSMEKTIIISVPEQVRIALDGRTQRWLAMAIRMPETDLSKRMNGNVEFTDEELKSINVLLKAKIKK